MSDIQYLSEQVLTADSASLVSSLNLGIPMPVYVLEALLDIHILQERARCRQLFQPIVQLAVLANYYYTCRATLWTSSRSLRQLFSGINMERLESGFRRLCRATNPEFNPHPVLETIGGFSMKDSEYRKHMRRMYDIIALLGINTEPRAVESYPDLNERNHLYSCPRFTTAEAVHIYASNIRTMSGFSSVPLQILTANKRTKDPQEVINDIMFALSATHMLIKLKNELSSLKTWIMIKFGMLCKQFYIVYTQALETSDAYRAFVSSVSIITRRNMSESRDDFALAEPVRLALAFAKAVLDTDVYAVPEYVACSVFAFLLRAHNVLQEDDSQDAIPSHDDTDNEDFDEHPAPFQEIVYLPRNPYGNPSISKCPRDVVTFLKTKFITCDLTQCVLTNLTDRSVTFENFRLEHHIPMLMEGAAQQLKMSPRQLNSYLSMARSGADVYQDPNESPYSDETLFANVRVRPAGRVMTDQEEQEFIRNYEERHRRSSSRESAITSPTSPYRRPTARRSEELSIGNRREQLSLRLDMLNLDDA